MQFGVNGNRVDEVHEAIIASLPRRVPVVQFSKKPYVMIDGRMRFYDFWTKSMDHPGQLLTMAQVTEKNAVNIQTFLACQYRAPMGNAPLFGTHFRLGVGLEVDVEVFCNELQETCKTLDIEAIGPILHDANCKNFEPSWMKDLLKSQFGSGYDPAYYYNN